MEKLKSGTGGHGKTTFFKQKKIYILFFLPTFDSLNLFGSHYGGKKGEVLSNPHLFSRTMKKSNFQRLLFCENHLGEERVIFHKIVVFFSLIASLTSSTVGDCQSESSCAQSSDDGDARWRIVKQIRPCD